MVGELPSSTCSFPLRLIMYLDRTLVCTITCMLGELASTSKNPPSTGIDEKCASYSTLIGCSISTPIGFFSTYSSSLESLIITNVGVEGENCFRRPHNVSSSPSPKIVACFNA